MSRIEPPSAQEIMGTLNLARAVLGKEDDAQVIRLINTTLEPIALAVDLELEQLARRPVPFDDAFLAVQYPAFDVTERAEKNASIIALAQQWMAEAVAEKLLGSVNVNAQAGATNPYETRRKAAQVRRDEYRRLTLQAVELVLNPLLNAPVSLIPRLSFASLPVKAAW